MKSTSQDLVAALTRIHADRDTTKFGVFDFLGAFGSPLEAMAYSKLFWPDCIDIDGMVIRKDVIEDEADLKRIRDVLQRWNGDIAKTEYTFNRLEVPCGVFGKRAGESTSKLDDELAQILAEMWRARLMQLYPDRKFMVTLDRDADGTVVVSFCQQ
jgi:hypothetical protein